jgi:gliding motility-associated lipoprotein GldH
MRRTFIFISFIALGTLSGCDDNRIYDTHIDIENALWPENKELNYEFEVADNKQAYNVIYNIRYTNTYPYYNLYLHYYLADSTGKVLKDHQLHMDLFDSKTGKPLGKGLGDLFDGTFLNQDLKAYIFPYAGKYKMKLRQYMRQSQLQGISSVGVKVEKVAAVQE